MKKFLILILIVPMVFLMSACGSDKTTGGGRIGFVGVLSFSDFIGDLEDIMELDDNSFHLIEVTRVYDEYGVFVLESLFEYKFSGNSLRTGRFGWGTDSVIYDFFDDVKVTYTWKAGLAFFGESAWWRHERPINSCNCVSPTRYAHEVQPLLMEHLSWWMGFDISVLNLIDGDDSIVYYLDEPIDYLVEARIEMTERKMNINAVRKNSPPIGWSFYTDITVKVGGIDIILPPEARDNPITVHTCNQFPPIPR